MNADELQRKLIALARSVPSATDVPYAFEKRVMAALATASSPDIWTLWSRSLWRAAGPCVAIMLIMGVWTAATAHSSGSSSSLAADLDQAVWGPLTSLQESW